MAAQLVSLRLPHRLHAGHRRVLTVEGRHEFNVRYASLVGSLHGLADGDISGVAGALEVFKLIDRDKHRHWFALIREHDPFVASPGSIDEFAELGTGVPQRRRESHMSDFTDVPP